MFQDSFACIHLNDFTNQYPTLIVLFATYKGFQALLSNINTSIPYQSFVCTQLKGFKCTYLMLIILLSIYHLFTHSLIVSSIPT